MTRTLAAMFTALACAGAAHAAGRAPLPSPLAAVSPEPPLGGGATASRENVSHSVTASTSVLVAIDEVGKPFAVTATQRLDVRGPGDYFFTIRAPVITVRAPAGSDSVPGMRTGAILWVGFNPQRQLLVSRATLDPPKVAPTLPLRIRASSGSVVLENTTAVSIGTTAAGRVSVTAPLHVDGAIGNHRVELVLTGSTRIRAAGRIDLRVEPVDRAADVGATNGRRLLRAAIGATLTYARVHQYAEYLGNPDPAGKSRTVYEYRTANPPHAAPIATVDQRGRSWLTTALVLGVLTAALVAGAALWSKKP